MVGEAKERDDTEKVAAEPADFSRLADASIRFMADQAAVMSMMTAFGMNLTTQMAGAFIGAMTRSAEKGEDSGTTAKAEVKPKGEVVPLRVVRKGRAAAADDLKKISGIGPKLEKMLNGMGVTSFAAIASWDEAEMRRIDEMLGLDNRVIRDNWAGQAKALLEG